MRRYSDSRAKQRIMDRAVRHLKYNDGIKDIVDKIKSKISEVITQFKDAPTGNKVTSLLSAIAALVGSTLAAQSLGDVIKNVKKVIVYRKELQKFAEKYGREPSGFTKITVGSEIGYRASLARTAGLKLVIALIGTFIAAVNAKIAIAKKQVSEGEDEARVVSEVMTR